MSQPLQHSMILTRLTEIGQALMQLNSCGYVEIGAARHLVAAGLAAPERIRVEIRHLPSWEFEGIGLTLEGDAAVENLDQQMAPISGLSDSRPFTTGPELSDSKRVVTCDYLSCLGQDALSQLDRQFAWGWCPEMPREPTQVFEVSLPMLKASRRKIASRLATKIGPVDPDFDQKGFMDELWDDG
ncbi:hypothetical protein [Pseudooceanicola sp. HF7]|uniref:hypothetical protein n=1 Tax=Pseudooceanicola sp. HF7 TaxID=2721560 RepID=UPI001430071A|nr:hypothetical protein [Pseudooceanicola sp. HF7]NIZ10971.1 hypothetical protein [Pseudooceanicola sp. HF7]